MPDDMIVVDRQSVIRAEVGKQHRRTLDLRIRRFGELEIAANMDPDCVIVLPVRMRADRPMRTPRLDRATLAYDIVIADACPALRPVACVDLFRGQIVVVRIARVMDHYLIRRHTLAELSKRQLRVLDVYSLHF